MKNGCHGAGVWWALARIFVDHVPAAGHRSLERETMKNQYQSAEKPTMYFIGVTTSKSSINKIFPLWAEFLGIGSCQLKGIDFKLHDQPELYREAVEFIKNDPLSFGALVTTHKIDLCNACRDIFDVLIRCPIRWKK